MKALKGIVFAVLALIVVGGWFVYDHFRHSKSKIRNVLLISIDTCRADHLSCYGYPRKTTPNIDAVAQDGVLFENAISPISLTLPAHSSMMTGTIPPYHGIHDNEGYTLAKSNVTLAEILKKEGFTTGATIGAFVLDSQFGIAQGFDSYNDSFDEDINTVGISERRGAEVSKYAMRWLEKNSKDPFFLFVHYYDPHTRYDPPEPFSSTYASDPYTGEIAYVDSCIGQVVDKLKKLGLYESTLLIIAGDHGESLGEHGEQAHGYFVYQATVKVPLIIKVPGGSEGKRVSDITGLIDILPTVCSLNEIQLPSEVQGKDLSGYIFGKNIFTKERSYYAESLYPTKYNANSLLALVVQQWKYIQTTRPELYDLVKDPQERNNLVKSHPHTARKLQNDLREILKQTFRQQDDTNKKVMDEQTLHRLESLGYVAGSGVKEDFEFDQSKDDPKDVVGFHTAISNTDDLMHKEKYDKAKQLCKKFISQRPGAIDPYLKISFILMHEKNYEEAASYLHKAIELDKINPRALNDLGITLTAMGKLEEAVEHYQQVVELKPDNSEAHNNLGIVLEKIGKREQAIGHFRQALKLKYDNPKTHYNLGIVLWKMNRIDEAISCYQKALKLKPDDIATSNDLAWVLATVEDKNLRDPIEAVRLAKRACELTQYSHRDFLDTLAVAYAAAGDFEKAIEISEKILQLAVNNEKLTNEIQERIELYKANKPYYDKSVRGGVK